MNFTSHDIVLFSHIKKCALYLCILFSDLDKSIPLTLTSLACPPPPHTHFFFHDPPPCTKMPKLVFIPIYWFWAAPHPTIKNDATCLLSSRLHLSLFDIDYTFCHYILITTISGLCKGTMCNSFQFLLQMFSLGWTFVPYELTCISI